MDRFWVACGGVGVPAARASTRTLSQSSIGGNQGLPCDSHLPRLPAPISVRAFRKFMDTTPRNDF